MDTTPTIGLHARGPTTFEDRDGLLVWDFDDNMEKSDAEFARLRQAITALGGSVGGPLIFDSGTF